jgi:hypothetical protein
MEQCSETSAHKIQTPGSYPEESIQHSEHGKSLKSRIIKLATKLPEIFVLVHFCKYFGSSEETLRFPEAKSLSLNLELEWV